MGIDVDNSGRVHFNPAHELLLNTSLDKNPSFRHLKGLGIHSVFRRVRASGNALDGNPFIYALKAKNGYSIDRKELWLFRENFRSILNVALDELDIDTVIPMPSGHRIAAYLAVCISRRHKNTPVVADILRKRTVAEVLADAQQNPPMFTSKSKRRTYRDQIRTWSGMPAGSLVSMKDVAKNIRPYFDPVALSCASGLVQGRRVLLVDDLLASGATFKSAESVVVAANCASVSALSLLSGL